MNFGIVDLSKNDVDLRKIFFVTAWMFVALVYVAVFACWIGGIFIGSKHLIETAGILAVMATIGTIAMSIWTWGD